MSVSDRKEEATNPKSARNILTSWGSFTYAVLINLFLTPFIVSSLGDTAYGIWVLLASLVGYMGLLDLGIRSAVMRYVARLHAQNEDQEASEVASTGMALFLCLGAVAMGVALVLAAVLPRVFNVTPAFLSEARTVMLLGGVTISISLVGGVYGGIVSAMQRFDLQSNLNVGITTVRAASVFGVLYLGQGLIALSIVQLVSTLVQTGGSAWMTRWLYPDLDIHPRHARRAHVRPIVSFAAVSSLLHTSRSIILSASSVIIGVFMPVAMVTYFSIASSLVAYTRPVIGAIAQTMTPRASAIQAVSDERELQRVFLSLARIASLVVAPIAVTFLIRGATFIGIWMGPEYAAPSGSILVVLAIALVFMAPGQVMMSALIGMKAHMLLVPFQLAEALLNVGLGVWWIQVWGLPGLAWANTLPTVVVGMVSMPWILRRAFNLGVGPLLLQVFLRPWVAMIPFALGSWYIETNWQASNLALYFMQVALALPLAAAGAWALAMSPGERAIVTQRVRAMLAGAGTP